MLRRSTLFPMFLLLMVEAGCEPVTVASTEPEHPGVARTWADDAHAVPAGTTFEATLDRAIDSRRTAPGTRFTARLTQPLVARDGDVVAPAGSIIAGTVASTGAVEAPQLLLRFDGIVTPRGLGDIHARIVSADHDRYVAGDLSPGQASARVSYDSMPFTEGMSISEPTGRPGGMGLLMRRHARLRLTLTQPLAFGFRVLP